MPKLSLVYEPSKILRTRAHKVKNVKDHSIHTLVKDMIVAMNLANGVGLAAPQINEGLRLIIVSTKKGSIACINPKILRKSLFKEWMEEGCLSVPGKYGIVKRHRSVTVRFIDLKGETVTMKTYGLLSQIFQHEVDHINGILFIDKAKNLKTL
jgi:peptide deformylase